MNALRSFAILAAFLLPGCVITNTPGFYSGYDRLSPGERQQVVFVADGQPIPAAHSRTLYAVTAQSLLNSLPAGDTTLVYMWSPHCHSAVCLPLHRVQAACTRKGYHLYVVTEYYNMEQIGLQLPMENPLLAVNHNFYKTDYCPKYTLRFASELTQGVTVPDSARYFRYFLFSGNRLVQKMNNIETQL